MRNEYRIYCHVCGLPSYLDTPELELEDALEYYTADEAEAYIIRNSDHTDTDKYGRKINLYVRRVN